METNSVSKRWWWLFGLVLVLGFGVVHSKVTYDRKAILINGQRRILFSGSIHYPRSTPEVKIDFCFSIFLWVLSVFSDLSENCFLFSDVGRSDSEGERWGSRCY